MIDSRVVDGGPVVRIPNLNGKLGCNLFVHVTKWPTGKDLYSSMWPMPVRVMDVGSGISVAAELIGVIKYECVLALPSYYVMLSHGGDSDVVMRQLLAEHGDAEMGVYLYRKV